MDCPRKILRECQLSILSPFSSVHSGLPALPLKEEHVHLQGRIEICCRVVQYMLRPDN